MRVFVTGGTGVVGETAVTALVRRGHAVRLFTRHAADDAAQWPDGVEPRPGSVTSADDLRGALDGCDAVLHLAAIVSEHPPEATFETVNVEGTRLVVREAERAGVGRLVYVSSLGADRGASAYHRSKRAGEAIARAFRGSWTVVRPGNVYGPGDGQISLLLKMVRTLPAVPVLGGGDQEFEPIWAEDLAEALAEAVERDDLAGRTLEVAGPERTTMNELVERLSALTDRSPMRLPVPGFVAKFGVQLGDLVGVDLPVNADQVTMVEEGNVVTDPAGNALDTVLRVTPTSLADGLRRLADAIPEQTPSEGVGAVKRKRFWADIVGCRHSAEALMEHFRRDFESITPWQMDIAPEPGTPRVPRAGETITMKLPLRGNIQVRVEELTPRRMTFVTLEGHPLAGAVRFTTEPRDERVRFEVQVYDRAANAVDWLVMGTVGGAVQNATWDRLVERVVEASGGSAPEGVESEIIRLDEGQVQEVDAWLKRLIVGRKREEREAEGAAERGVRRG